MGYKQLVLSPKDKLFRFLNFKLSVATKSHGKGHRHLQVVQHQQGVRIHHPRRW